MNRVTLGAVMIGVTFALAGCAADATPEEPQPAEEAKAPAAETTGVARSADCGCTITQGSWGMYNRDGSGCKGHYEYATCYWGPYCWFSSSSDSYFVNDICPDEPMEVSN